jgi:AraC-like DNA-binding protein
MSNHIKKVVILSKKNLSTDECIQLLEANGFHVEVRQPRKREWLMQLNDDLPWNELKDKKLADKTCKYLIDNLNCKLTLDYIASQVGSSRSQLAKVFKRITGTGVFEWLRNQRLLKAKTLLLHSSLTVQEIGFEVGYENQANFASAYKKQFSLSPRQQRYSV